MPNNQMPHNIDAERALLGCVLIDESVQSEILERVKEEDLYDEGHRLILAAMKTIYAGHKTVDVVTLTDELDREGKLERAGGLQAITELTALIPSAANYRQYLEIVRRDSVNRALIRAASDIIQNSAGSPEDRDAIGYAEKLVYDISKREDSGSLAGLAEGDVIEEVISKFEMIQNDPSSCRGLETGFRHLDRITNGLQKSDLIVIAARPGMGKTSLAMNIVENACLRKGKVAAVFSLEMPRVQIVQRLLCSYAGVSMSAALSGKLNGKDWKNLMRASDQLRKSKLFIDDSSRVTPAEILSKCRRLATAEGGIDLIMIDYIQLMGGEGTDRQKGNYRNSPENRQQEIASITRDLKIMAKELNVPVIALSQLRRIQTKEAQLSDLRESGAIEQDADIVMFINRPDVGATPEELVKGNIVKGAAELVIAKHRNGETGRIQLRFLGELTKFIDVEAQGEPTEAPSHKKRDFGENPTAEEAFGGETDIPIDD